MGCTICLQSLLYGDLCALGCGHILHAASTPDKPKAKPKEKEKDNMPKSTKEPKGKSKKKKLIVLGKMHFISHTQLFLSLIKVIHIHCLQRFSLLFN